MLAYDKALLVEIYDVCDTRYYKVGRMAKDKYGRSFFSEEVSVEVRKGTRKDAFLNAWFIGHKWIRMERVYTTARVWLLAEEGDLELLHLAAKIPANMWGVWKKAMKMLKEGREAALEFLRHVAVVSALAGEL